MCASFEHDSFDLSYLQNKNEMKFKIFSNFNVLVTGFFWFPQMFM